MERSTLLGSFHISRTFLAGDFNVRYNIPYLPCLKETTSFMLQVVAYASAHSRAMVKISIDFAAFILPTHQSKSPSHTGYEAQQPPNQSWISNEEQKAREASSSQLGPAQHLVNHAIGSSGQPKPNSSYEAVSGTLKDNRPMVDSLHRCTRFLPPPGTCSRRELLGW
ncbi:hypothetical protein BDR22DRAFT_528472 [Usnea florida]